MAYRHTRSKNSWAVGEMLCTATHAAAAALTPHIAAMGQSSRSVVRHPRSRQSMAPNAAPRPTSAISVPCENQTAMAPNAAAAHTRRAGYARRRRSMHTSSAASDSARSSPYGVGVGRVDEEPVADGKEEQGRDRARRRQEAAGDGGEEKQADDSAHERQEPERQITRPERARDEPLEQEESLRRGLPVVERNGEQRREGSLHHVLRHGRLVESRGSSGGCS